MTDLAKKLASLQALVEAATPGPIPAAFLYWALRHASKHDVDWFTEMDGSEMSDDVASRCPRKEDAEVIAALRNAAPALLAVVRAAAVFCENDGNHNERCEWQYGRVCDCGHETMAKALDALAKVLPC